MNAFEHGLLVFSWLVLGLLRIWYFVTGGLFVGEDMDLRYVFVEMPDPSCCYKRSDFY